MQVDDDAGTINPRGAMVGAAEDAKRISMVGVLGPVGVWDEAGAPVRLSPARQGMLVALLQDPWVSAEALKDVFWPSRPAPQATNLLHNCIHALRDVLGRKAIDYSDGRYELRLDPLLVDWARFQRLYQAAGAELAAGRPSRAKAFLADAMRLWRGEALGGPGFGHFAEPLRLRMEEGRVAGAKRLIDAGLALGEHEELIAELVWRVSRDRTDERFACQLMLAFERSGRLKDALRVAADCRAALAESGLVAGRALGDTEAQVLRRSHPAGPASAPSPAPQPGAVTGFLLAARWPETAAAPWFLGEAELGLLMEELGTGTLAAAGGSVIVAFDQLARSLDAAITFQRAVAARKGGLARILIVEPAPALSRAASIDRCFRLLDEVADGGTVVFLTPRGGGSDSPSPLPDGAQLRRLGLHHPDGVGPAVDAYQLLDERLAPSGCHSFVTVRQAIRHNVPAASGPLFGRVSLLEEIAVGLPAHPVVTLTGPGGMGKTHAAVHAAAALLAGYHDGVWFVALEAVSDPEVVVDAVVDTVGAPRHRSLPALDALCRYLEDKHLLLVLDGCEHVLLATRRLVERVTSSCAAVDVLVTSTTPLECFDEHVIAVPSLERFDASGRPERDADLASTPSVSLFLSRMAKRQVPPTAEEIESVSRICALVDGLPLAICLAAARADELGVAVLHQELEHAFAAGTGLRLLDARHPDGGARHVTISATLDWSYQRLVPQDQCLLARLSVFAGPFNLQEAVDVCADRDVAAADVPASLSRLVGTSAVEFDRANPDSDRYRLLGPVRDFAASKLTLRPEGAAWLRQRHAELYVRLAEEARAVLGGPEEEAMLDRLDARAANIRTAFQWAIETATPPAALELAAGLWQFWFVRGHLSEGRRLLRAALALDPTPSPARIRALVGCSYLSWWQGDMEETRRATEETVAAAEFLHDPWGRAWGLMGMAAPAMFQPDAPSPEMQLEESVELFEQLGCDWDCTQALQLLGGVAWHRGDYPKAADAYGRAIGRHRAAGRRTMLDAQRAHGLMLALLGQVDQGKAEVWTSFAAARDHGDRVGIAHSLAYAAAIATYEDDEESGRMFMSALLEADDVGDAWVTQWAVDGLAGAACRNAQFEVAAKLLGRAEAMAAQTGINLAPREQILHARYAQRARSKLPDTYEQLRAEGARSTPSEAMRLALSLGL